MLRIVCCVLLGVKLQISHGCNLKKILVVQKYGIVWMANLEQQLEKRAILYPLAAITVLKCKCAQ